MERKYCGYQGHSCSDKVQFISRYRGQSDYCLNGVRLRIADDGTVSTNSGTVTPAQVATLEAYFTVEHAEYCDWHAIQVARFGPDFPALKPRDIALLIAG